MTEQTPANTKSSIKISEGSGKSNPGSMLKSIAKKVLSNNRTQITPDSQNNNEGNSLLANAINNLVSTIRPGSLGEGSPNPFTGMSGFGTDPGSMTPDGIETAKYLENDSADKNVSANGQSNVCLRRSLTKSSESNGNARSNKRNLHSNHSLTTY